MLKPLFWMFKEKDFKKHFCILLLIELLFFVFGIIALCVLLPMNLDRQIGVIVSLMVMFLIPFLFIQGYFWELTECVINREIDLTASNIYDGKINNNIKIKLPKINVLRMLWRGIASIVASIILFVPAVSILIWFSTTGCEAYRLYDVGQDLILYLSQFIMLFIVLFVPALLYNYAKKDSVFAMLNLPSAVYIMGNYTWQYVKNTALFVLLSFVYSYILSFLAKFLNVEISINLVLSGRQTMSVNAENLILSTVLLLLVSFVFRVYFVYVNAYLLGTIAPRQEY